MKLLLLVFYSLRLFGSIDDCNEKMRSFWNISPKAQVLAIGMLAETPDHKIVLALSDYYWGSHENIHRHLVNNFTAKRILWSGEMLIENPKIQHSSGVIVLSVNTSGYYWRTTQELNSPHVNDPLHLKSGLESFRPDLTSEYTQHDTFSDEHAHIDPLFQTLHQRNLFSEGDSVRHRFNNILGVVYNLSYYLTKNPAAPAAKQINLMSKISSQTANDIFLFFNSHSKFSREGGKLAQLPEKGRNDFEILIDLLRTVGPKGNPNEEPEVIILNP